MAPISPLSNRLPATPTCTPSARICTPSVLYGGLSPWAETPATSRVQRQQRQQPAFFLEEGIGGPADPLVPGQVFQISRSSQSDASLSSSCSAETAPSANLPEVQALLSKDFLRKVCAPLFEEMVDAVQQALEVQVKTSGVPGNPEALARSFAAANQPCISLAEALRCQDESATSAGASTSTASSVSFTDTEASSTPPCPKPVALVLPGTETRRSSSSASCCSNEDEAIASPSAPEVTQSGTAAVAAAEGSCVAEQQAAQGIPVKRSTMVCHHWKSKGWCRLGTDCKFMHPEHKRGVGSGCVSNERVSSGRDRKHGRVCAGAVPLSKMPGGRPMAAGSQDGFYPPSLPTAASMGYGMQGFPQAAFWVFQSSP